MLKRHLLAVITVLMTSAWVYAVPPGTNADIDARTAPFGSVCRVGGDCGTASVATSASGGPLSGQQVYDKYCTICHATGVGDAPTLADHEMWDPRVAKGMDALMISTLNGINTMPAKGTCMSCSDDELGLAVTYMLDQLP